MFAKHSTFQKYSSSIHTTKQLSHIPLQALVGLLLSCLVLFEKLRDRESISNIYKLMTKYNSHYVKVLEKSGNYTGQKKGK